MTKLTPMKAIRAKCIDCSGGSYKEVAQCLVTDCSLYLYRYGKRPTKEALQKQNKAKQDN